MNHFVRAQVAWITLAAGTAAGQEAPSASLAAPAEGIGSITGKELGGHLRFLSSDLMKGRDTASPEIALASEYLAGHLLGFGAEPAGDVEDGKPTYFATFPLDFSTPKAEGTTLTLVVEKDGEKKEIEAKLFDDFIVMPRGVAGGEVSGSVVLAGPLTKPAEKEGDPPVAADPLEGLDAAGKWVLVVTPEGDASGRNRRGGGGPGSLISLREMAREKGALGVISVRAFSTENRPAAETMSFLRQFFDRPSMTLGEPSATPPVIMLENQVRDELNEKLKLSEAKPGDVAGLTARFHMNVDQQVKKERNVIGLFPGSDPEKKHEVVVYSAHYDHVGVGADGQIYNGSDDNGSGTSALLEIAEAFGEGQKPARTVAFLWVSGEEKGLLGSRWFADHVTLPEGYKIVADINMDMVSRNDSHQVSVTPSPEHPDHNSMVNQALEAAKAEDMELKFDADQFFGRTDSYNFAAKGIPIIFFFSGVHEDYHQPGDDFPKADLEKAGRIARMAYRLGWEVASAPGVPEKTKPAEKEGGEGR